MKLFRTLVLVGVLSNLSFGEFPSQIKTFNGQVSGEEYEAVLKIYTSREAFKGMCETFDLKITFKRPQKQYLAPGESKWIFDTDLIQESGSDFAERLDTEGTLTMKTSLIQPFLGVPPSNLYSPLTGCKVRAAGKLAVALRTIRIKFQGRPEIVLPIRSMEHF